MSSGVSGLWRGGAGSSRGSARFWGRRPGSSPRLFSAGRDQLPLGESVMHVSVSDKAKAVVAAVGTVVTALTAAFADDVVDIGEAGNVVAVVIAAVASV